MVNGGIVDQDAAEQIQFAHEPRHAHFLGIAKIRAAVLLVVTRLEPPSGTPGRNEASRPSEATAS